MERIKASKSRCKQCGKCCKTEVCLIGKIMLGTIKLPCPALVKKGGKYWCGLIIETEKYVFPAIGISPIQYDAIRRHLWSIFDFGEGCDLEHWDIDRDIGCMITDKPKIVVAMPAYDEGYYIDAMVTEVKKYADEVIVVDDGSNDDTARRAEVAGATVVRHSRNMGYGVVIMGILAEARKRTFDALVIIDADTQHDPSDIPRLIQPVLNGYDIAIGSRNRKDIPPYRYLGGRVLSILTRILSGVNVLDSQSGFRAFSQRAVMELELKEKGMAVSSEMVFEVARTNLRITEVPISVKYTKDGSTMNPVVQGFYTLFRIIVMMLKRGAR